MCGFFQGLWGLWGVLSVENFFMTFGLRMEEKTSSSVIVVRGKILLSLICAAANPLAYYFTESKSSNAMQICGISLCPLAQRQDVRPFHSLLLDIFSLAAILIMTIQTIPSFQRGVASCLPWNCLFGYCLLFYMYPTISVYSICSMESLRVITTSGGWT